MVLEKQILMFLNIAHNSVKQCMSEVARLKETMDETEVTAPVSGIVQSVNSEDSSNNTLSDT